MIKREDCAKIVPRRLCQVTHDIDRAADTFGAVTHATTSIETRVWAVRAMDSFRPERVAVAGSPYNYPRGNKPGVDAQFIPPVEQLAYDITVEGEADLPGIHSEPWPVVVKALTSHTSAQLLWEDLPDVERLQAISIGPF